MSVFASREELEAASVCVNRRWQAWHVRLHVRPNNLVACKHTWKRHAYTTLLPSTQTVSAPHYCFFKYIYFLNSHSSWIRAAYAGTSFHNQRVGSSLLYKSFLYFPCLSCCLFFHLFLPGHLFHLLLNPDLADLCCKSMTHSVCERGEGHQGSPPCEDPAISFSSNAENTWTCLSLIFLYYCVYMGEENN